VRACLVRALAVGGLLLTLAFVRPVAAQPSLGHKLPGTAGLDAGSQPEPGVYAAYRFAYYDAISLRDRDGNPIPIAGFDMDAFAHVFGLGATLRFGRRLHLGTTIAVPVARLKVTTNEPQATVDQFGLADVFVEPIKVGGVWSRLDLVTSYAFYAPTRQISREGLGAPQWAHQFSAGGTVYFDRASRVRLSALFSYNLHQRKQDIDVTRGDSVQIQGGFGGAVFEIVEVGLAGYALWQVRDDRGSDLPPALRGRRDRVFGLGPEINLLVPALRTKLGVRYMRDLGVRGRPEGQIVVVGLSARLWAPRRDAGARPRPDDGRRRPRDSCATHRTWCADSTSIPTTSRASCGPTVAARR